MTEEIFRLMGPKTKPGDLLPGQGRDCLRLGKAMLHGRAEVIEESG